MNDQKKKDSSKIDFKTVRVGDGDSAKEIKDANLASHGIIAKDKDGKVVTKVDGHSYGQSKVDEVIKQLLAEPEPAPQEEGEKKKKKEGKN